MQFYISGRKFQQKIPTQKTNFMLIGNLLTPVAGPRGRGFIRFNMRRLWGVTGVNVGAFKR